MLNVVIQNGTLVNEGGATRGDLYIADGRIEDIVVRAEDQCHLAPEGCAVIDARGCYVMPGVIDTHVHFRDGGEGGNPAGDFATESGAALAGGVTSVIDMPNTNPPTISLEALEAKEQMASKKSAVNYGFMLGATNDNIDDLLSIDPRRYAAIKLFLGSSTGNMLVDDGAALDRLFSESRKLIVAHCESEPIVRANLANLKAEFEGTAQETAALHPKVRNTEACFVSTYQAVARARKHGTRLHVAHVSTATELSLLSNQPLAQKNVSAEVTPNHLWFDDRDYTRLGNKIKCNPSIKSNDDRLALWAALYDGLIDTIATDHAPHPLASKEKPYFQAPSGIPSIQHSLRLMLEAMFNEETLKAEASHEVEQTWLPLLVEKMCHNPATLFGIKERGFLRKGYWADIVVVRPYPQGEKITNDSLLYKCGWSPLEGMTLHSKIEHVLVNGAERADGTHKAARLEFEF